MTPEKTECEHFTVRRILDSWECLECGLEFKPVLAAKPKPRGSRGD